MVRVMIDIACFALGAVLGGLAVELVAGSHGNFDD